MLLLHGWAGSRRSFAALLPLLPAHVRAVAVDLRGHGDAGKPPDGYDLPTLASDVIAVLDTLELDRAVVVGVSSGGYVAQQVTIGHVAFRAPRLHRIALRGAVGRQLIDSGAPLCRSHQGVRATLMA